MKRVLVTGVSGLLGSTIARQWAKQCEVVGTYFSRPVDVDGVECLQIDLADRSQYGPLKRFDPDVVVHCAALTDVDQCEREPRKAHMCNVEITRNLGSLASTHAARFIHLSTDAVFDGTDSLYSEHDETNPINVYGRTKLAAEHVAKQIHTDTVVVRTNIYGWNVTSGQSLAEWMLEKLRGNKELPAFSDAYFSPMYTGHLSSCLFELAAADFTGVLHVAGSERCNKLAFAEQLADIFDLDSTLIVPTSIDTVDFDAPRGQDLSLSVSQAREQISCGLPTVQDGLERMKRCEDE